MNTGRGHGKPQRGPAWLIAAVLALALAGCDPEPEVTTLSACDKYLDQGRWDAAIEACSQIQSDEGYSKTAQAYMGRAGISLLALIDKVASSNAEGLALVLSAFAVDAVQFADVQSAIDYLLLIQTLTNTDSFNLIVASDVAISTLIKNELGITVDVDGVMTIPGITDSGIDTLSASSTPAQIQTAFASIYAGTYYQTTPPVWDSGSPGVIDLASVSAFIQANARGSAAVTLGELTDLNFAALIDNGQCALSAGQTASSGSFSADGPGVGLNFPRRLNTSDATAVYLSDELQFVLLNNSGGVDVTREWQGSFALPSRLLNPDMVGINCGAGIALDNFTACMGATRLNTSFTQVRKSDLVTNITCGGANCAASATAGWPVTSADGNPATDEFGAEGATIQSHLAEVLHQLYPIDNNDASPSTSGLHCVAGDGWVHAREYDYYLRTLGQ